MGNEAWLAIIISLAMAVGFFFIGFWVRGRVEGAIKKSEPSEKEKEGK